ncbi:hypothetical protein OD770_30535 [Pseudomonas aeruginosa]|nr:hypothetical protein [Pseudomonas aeruginosa]MCV4183845.1 hypothetical protein [Pseudomonas aeruginosa]
MTASKIQMDQIRSTSATVTGENIRAGSQKKSSLSPAEGLQGASPDATCTCPSGNGSLRHPCPAHPAVEQAGGDELEKFLAWACKEYGIEDKYDLNENHHSIRENKKGWMARAALAQPSPAQTQPSPAPTLRAAIDVANDRFEVPVAKWGTDLVGEEERPEVAEVAFVLRNIGAMDAEDIDGDNVDLRFEDAEGRDTGCDVSIVEYAEKAADLFEQHDRIVGELRADRDSWAEQAEQRLADWDEMRKERDAALVEVERLSESKGDPVGSFEKCMKVMYERDENAKRLEVALARVAELEGKLTDWVHEGFRLNEALAVAKAQHSVPDDDMILQIFADNAEHSEQGDEHGYCIVREQHAQAIARKLLAAAPGNSAQHSVPEGWKLVPIEPLLNMMSDKDHDTRITAERQLLSILADVPGNSVPQAWIDVQAERRRQITAEGWTPEHDDLYCAAELPRAAAAYILNGANDEAPAIWPFVTKWWKPRDARSNYVRAGALILAEIERLDRARQGGRS